MRMSLMVMAAVLTIMVLVAIKLTMMVLIVTIPKNL